MKEATVSGLDGGFVFLLKEAARVDGWGYFDLLNENPPLLAHKLRVLAMKMEDE